MRSREREWMMALSTENQLQQVLKTNQYTEKFGLQLTEDDARELMEARREELQKQERIEFGEGVLKKIIFFFCDSPYIYQDNYMESLYRLQEIFYLYKNESMDDCSDEELLEYMKEAFEGECQGSLDYLEDTALERFAREIREGTRKFLGRFGEDEE